MAPCYLCTLSELIVLFLLFPPLHVDIVQSHTMTKALTRVFNTVYEYLTGHDSSVIVFNQPDRLDSNETGGDHNQRCLWRSAIGVDSKHTQHLKNTNGEGGGCWQTL